MICEEDLITQILPSFAIEGSFVSSETIESGLINHTSCVSFSHDGRLNRYIIQRLNSTVFPEPEKVMENIQQVLGHLKAADREKSPRLLRLIPTDTQTAFFHSVEFGFWRCYTFIESSKTFDTCESKELAFEAARGFGEFIDRLADFPADRLHEVLPDFHHTPLRYQDLVAAKEKDEFGRAESVQAELQFLKERESFFPLLTDGLENGSLPLRVTHNDTKINNILFDAASLKAAAVIDLDTVMPGSALYDFGDLVRTSVSDHLEDTVDLDEIEVRKEVFVALASGFLEGCPSLTEAEIELMPKAGVLIALELAMRFLSDYLNGDSYFKTTRAGQNLDRCRVQLRLAELLERTEGEFREIINTFHRG